MFARTTIAKSLALLVIVALPLAADAQVINLGDVLSNALHKGTPIQQTSGMQPFNLPAATTIAGVKDGGKIWRGKAQPLYKTKVEFIAAAKNGDLLGLANVNTNTPLGEEGVMQDRLTASIAVILADEYQTGVPSDSWCEMTFETGAVRLLAQITGLYTMTLTDTPPDFTSANTDQVTRAREQVSHHMIFGSCTKKVLGADQPYPMVESLKDLLRSYAAATKDVVDAKRAEKVQAYQVAQQRQLEAQQQAAAERAKAEQQRIEDERKYIEAQRKRIEKEQQDQKARDDARVSF